MLHEDINWLNQKEPSKMKILQTKLLVKLFINLEQFQARFCKLAYLCVIGTHGSVTCKIKFYIHTGLFPYRTKFSSPREHFVTFVRQSFVR